MSEFDGSPETPTADGPDASSDATADAHPSEGDVETGGIGTATLAAEAPAESPMEDREEAEQDAPPVPSDLGDTGLEPAFVDDLLLKTLYRSGALSGRELSRSTALPYHAILDGLLLQLQQRHLVEVRRTEGHGREGYVFDLTGEGRSRAREALSVSRYVGPAPVPFEDYVDWIDRQSTRHRPVSPEDLRAAVDHLVLDEDFIDAIGAAVNSGSSLFLYGPPGNGKTVMAEAIAELPDDPIFVPRAVSVDGNAILQIYDPLFHHPLDDDEISDAEEGDSLLRTPRAHDPRYVRVRRPAVKVGGELTLEELDLQLDEEAGVFRAPPQLKANGGVFIIDDFGRQRVRARDLLNRWMVPLEHHVDYLRLPRGQKLPVPFDCFLVFATNLDPLDLVEEAFLRRLRYKVPATDPDREQYEEIFRACCEAADLEYVNAAVDLVYRGYYRDRGIPPRACHPRDLVAHICDEARYRGEDPVMDRDTMERACSSYFLDISDAARGLPATGPSAEQL